MPTRADVIERLLDHFGKTRPQIPAEVTAANKSISPLPREASVSGRAPRERGATIELDGHEMRVISVRDMYEQVLKFILDKGALEPSKTAHPLQHKQGEVFDRGPANPPEW